MDEEFKQTIIGESCEFGMYYLSRTGPIATYRIEALARAHARGIWDTHSLTHSLALVHLHLRPRFRPNQGLAHNLAIVPRLSLPTLGEPTV